MTNRYAIGISGEDAALISAYGKQMVGSGHDPLPDYDVPLEIHGSGFSSVYKLSHRGLSVRGKRESHFLRVRSVKRQLVPSQPRVRRC